MGVSLERVQFKFASIIGELCSDPVIMSQFAVWVDLKMAEYKAKGAMSLECSGDKPEPSWMKGVIPPALSSRLLNKDHNITNPRKGIGVTGDITPATFSPNRSRTHPAELRHNQSSPEVVVVKPEPTSPSPSLSAEAYPLTFHQNTASHTTPSRKRFLDDGNVTERGIHFKKHQRSSPSSSSSHVLTDTHGTPDNQSLLSVIGEESSKTAELRDIQVTVSDENSIQVIASTSDGDPGWAVQEMSSFDNSSVDYTCNLSQEDTSNNGYHGGSRLESPEGANIAVDLMPEKTINYSTVRKTMTDVRTFIRWLQPFGEQRRPEEIPPVELDAYLQQFYPTVTKRDGSAYNANSLRYLQASLGRYLKDQNYPENITTSPLFSGSQQALDLRKKELQALTASQQSIQH